VHGKAVQVEPMKPTLKPPGTNRLKLKYDELLSIFAFNFNLARYSTGAGLEQLLRQVGWCRLTVSNPALKAPMVSALETIM